VNPSLLVTMALFGSAFAGSKVVVEQLPHQVAALLRFALAALILVVLVRFERTTTPLRAAGLLLGLAGAVVFFAGARFGGPRLLGDLLYLLGAAAWAAYTIASKRVLAGVDPLRATTIATAVGAAALLIPAVPALPAADWAAVSGTAWAALAYLAVGPTALAYLLYYRGLAQVSPSTATITMFAVPFFGVTCSALLLHESFTPTQVVGAVIMLPGAFLAVVNATPRRAIAGS
jgi:drug/metabolite transporter (DMT)-like permease